ncbi:MULTISPECIES: nitrophenyl compound nitroreductase subunit ArsF family protein [unclassified Lentimonas]|uniref:nitrophenyl compound nitroreductase subunit ArsF family protein n=1 Tax=unclassified Lentimonas TaxID=2630993 RepID=UPI001326D3AD|nr:MULTISPECIES: nitrophenyl compound nitroreductase subunit ArsF family protein [unclassified Lentimonas]CAA6677351.1 Unannotated [Lentimonas sp. CC4]CAA6686896.1 Unannotated [Lentimonas sp. CC6]CAA7074597.1 Unannotated [Lentimonas sp. CC4]CAA7169213.1 Unannotated [Lentimonas sp. CC21]CAA7180386.1 Unannotated [Lentimonas sp. CC8]
MRKLLQTILITFAVGSMAYSIWTRNQEPASQTITVPATAELTQSTQVPASSTALTILITYFTTDVRCTSCLNIETLTRAAVEESFAQELAAGRVRFQTLNLDRPENEHFTSDYDIAFKTVVISEETSEEVIRWEKRDDVWKLLDQPEAFKAYITSSVREFLRPQSS